jgi:hypothetical protein
MKSLPMLLVAAGLAWPAASAFADEAVAPRYQIEKTKYGFVRLDRLSGAMTFCREGDENLTCDPASAEQTGTEDEVQSLGRLVGELEQRLRDNERRTKALEDQLKALGAAPRKTGDPEKAGKLPSDRELDDAFNYMEGIMRRFMDLSRELNQEEGLPQKT